MRNGHCYAAAALASVGLLVGTPATAGNGNGAPSGAHYTLNIIGVKDKTAPMDGANGHVIFVKLEGKSKIWLCESGVDRGCENVEDFQVIDKNGTDHDGALFALPNPDPDGDGTTVYSVFARALGTPGGHSISTTCATGPGEDGVLGTADDEEVCSVIQMELTRDERRSRFDNVTKYLFYIYADVDGDGSLERYSLFDDALAGYFWEYDNDGRRHVQLRFYECATIVPNADDPNGLEVDTACFE